MIRTAIVDSTCLIVLQRVGRFALLQEQFATIIIPPEVSDEFGERIEWAEVRAAANRTLFHALRIHLGRGEAAAIALAAEIRPSALVLDDRKARAVAKRIGLGVIGTIELALRAKHSGLIPEVRSVLDEFNAAGFYVSDGLREKALRNAGEFP